MSPRSRTLKFALFTFVAIASVLAPPRGAAGAELERDSVSGLQYLEVVTGGAALADPVPIVIAIHGLGDRPESFRLLLDELPAKARILFPRGPIPHGRDGFSWFNFRADDGEGSGELIDGMRESSKRVAELIASSIRKRGGPSRVVVCGFSQGGMLSFELAAEHPELVAEAIPVSGYLPSPLWPAERPAFKPLPRVLALHGDADRLIPVEGARWSIEALRSNGFTVDLRSWPGVPHALSTEIRATLIESVVAAVQRLAPAAAAEQAGPPEPATRPQPPVDPTGAAAAQSQQ